MFYRNRTDGLIYTEDEALEWCRENVTEDYLEEAMFSIFSFEDFFKYLPEEEREKVREHAIRMFLFDEFRMRNNRDE